MNTLYFLLTYNVAQAIGITSFQRHFTFERRLIF